MLPPSGGLGKTGLTRELAEMLLNAQAVSPMQSEVILAMGRLRCSPTGVLHCVDGALALLLPPLHVGLWGLGRGGC